MAWLYRQRGSKNWWLGYRVAGKQVLRSTKTADRKVAEKELARVRAMFEHARAETLTEELFRLLTSQHLEHTPLQAALTEWLEERRAHAVRRTLEKYELTARSFAAHVGANDKKPLLREIGPDNIRSYLSLKQKVLSVGSVRLERRILSAFFNWCVNVGKLSRSPVPKDAVADRKARRGQHVRRGFTLEEVRSLYSKAPTPFWRYMTVMGALTGQRMGDLICLPWEWVDFHDGVVHFTQSKTGKLVHVPMHPAVRKVLLDLLDRTPEPKRKGPLWPEEATHYRRYGAKSFSGEFYESMLVPCGLVPPRDYGKGSWKGGGGRRTVNAVSFHSFRHAFVSMLKVTGGNQAIAKELAGHSSDVVSDLYTHLPAEALQQAVAKLPEIQT